MVIRVRPARKTRKMDLRAGCRRGTTPSNSPGYPKTQGCSLREIERKLALAICHNSRPAGCATMVKQVKIRKPNSCACAREAEAEFWQVMCNFEAGFSTSVGPCQGFCATRVVCNQTQRPPEKPWIAASHHPLTLPRNHTPPSLDHLACAYRPSGTQAIRGTCQLLTSSNSSGSVV